MGGSYPRFNRIGNTTSPTDSNDPTGAEFLLVPNNTHQNSHPDSHLAAMIIEPDGYFTERNSPVPQGVRWPRSADGVRA